MRILAQRPHLEGHGVRLIPMPVLTAAEDACFRSAGVAARLRLVARGRRRLLRELAETPEASSVIIQRHADQLPSVRVERTIVAGRRFVYDLDDAIWIEGRPAGGHRLARLRGTARKVQVLAARADHVVAGNAYLADWLGRFSDRITVVPSTVDVAGIPVRAHEEREEVVYGWIGSPTTAGYLHRLPAALEATARELKARVRLLVVGGPAPPVQGVTVEERPWSAAAERDALGQIDIGLMPMPDNDWTRGKCGYKALLYMAAGLPVVADDVGVSVEVIGDRVGGAIARSEADWIEALVSLGRDRSLRAGLGAAARSRVEASYATSVWAPTLAAIVAG